MKRKIFVISIIIIAIICFIPKEKEEMRIRVLANSDTLYDQQMKYKVVDILTSNLEKIDVSNIEKSINILQENISKVLKDNNFTIEIKNVKFPPKEYNGQIISGGVYKTLLVTIGKGQGKNWWSLLYPEYFNVSYEDFHSEEVEIKSYFWELLK